MKKIFKSKWFIAIVSAFLPPIATLIVDAIAKKPILSTLLSVIKTIWGWIVSFLTFEIQVWWILLGIGVIILGLFIATKIYDSRQEDGPSFLSYTEDIFGSWKWSWDWKLYKYDGKWHVEGIKAHCPDCDTPMFHDSWEIEFSCPRCNYRNRYGDHHKHSKEVEALILDNISRKNKSKSD